MGEKTTTRFYHAVLFLLLLAGATAFAQPAINSFSPTVVTQRSVVEIHGTGFTGVTAVRFGGIAATSYVVNSTQKITAVVGTGASGAVSVVTAAGTAELNGLTYITATAAAATAGVNRVITDHGGYFTSVNKNNTTLPNTINNLTGFGFGSSVYTTGVDNTTVLSHFPGAITARFYGLPVFEIAGNTSGSNDFLIMGSLIDGSTASKILTPEIAALRAEDVLTDGKQGLALGTGVTNLSSSAILTFSVDNIDATKINDEIPDVLITQIAVVTANSDVYAFIDANGNIIGTPKQATLQSIPEIASYKDDLFNLPSNTPYATATPINGSGAINETKTVRMIAFKLSDFGLDSGNIGSITGFRIFPGGQSDMAFIGYNADAILLTPPDITVQPQSKIVCTGTGASATFSVEVDGFAYYQWKKNGVNITGATQSSYTINNVVAGDVGTYTVVITNGSVDVESEPAYLNTVIQAQPQSATVCGGTPVNLSVQAAGLSLTYQWYSNTINSNTGGTLITGATSSSYSPPVDAAGTLYYYAVITNNNQQCGGAVTNPAAVTVTSPNFTWNGSVSTDWHTAGNWDCNTIPDLTSNVLIPQTANQPIVSNGTTALGHTLTIQAGAVLTINAANNIELLGAITVASTGNLVVSSTANLVQDPAGTTNQNTGNITVKRNSSLLFRQDYTLWSTPVAGQNIFQFSPQTLASRFYTYGTLQDLFVTVPGLSASSTSTFTTGVAYLIRMPNGNATPGYNAGTTPITLNQQFKGVPNNGTINVPVSLETNRYNGVGNPYPSAINIHNFIDGNEDELDNLGTLYFWRKKNNDANTSYSSINKTGYSENGAEGGDVGSAFEIGQEANWVINPGQGFVIRATPGTTHVTFNNTMRRAVNNNQFFRQQQNSMSRYWLDIESGNGAFGQTLVGYSGHTTNGLDYGYDGPLLNDGTIAIYTNAAGTDLSIQAKGSFTVADVVPVTYRVETAGNYTIKLHAKDGLFETQAIYLKDNTTGTIHDVTGGAYSFASEAGTFTSRFEVQYVSGALSTDKPVLDANTVIVYKSNNTLHINTGNVQMADARLFDTRGRLVHEVKNINAAEASISGLNVGSQVMILQVTTQDGTTISKKVIF